MTSAISAFQSFSFTSLAVVFACSFYLVVVNFVYSGRPVLLFLFSSLSPVIRQLRIQCEWSLSRRSRWRGDRGAPFNVPALLCILCAYIGATSML